MKHFRSRWRMRLVQRRRGFFFFFPRTSTARGENRRRETRGSEMRRTSHADAFGVHAAGEAEPLDCVWPLVLRFSGGRPCSLTSPLSRLILMVGSIICLAAWVPVSCLPRGFSRRREGSRRPPPPPQTGALLCLPPNTPHPRRQLCLETDRGAAQM